MPAPDRPLNLLRVVFTLRPEAGGPSESIRQSTAALRAHGHQVELATADAPGTVAPIAGPFHLLGGVDTGTLGAWLRREHGRFDAVLVQGLWHSGWAVRAALRGTRAPYLVFPHGMLDPWFARAYPGKHFKKQFYWWWRERRVVRDAAAVCFTCEEERRLAAHTFWPYAAREQVVAYRTATPPDDPTHRAAFAASYPALAARPFLLFLSRLHDKKAWPNSSPVTRPFAKLTPTRRPWRSPDQARTPGCSRPCKLRPRPPA